MIPSLKSEFRKILSVRSTLFIILIALAAVILFAFFIDGYNNDMAKKAHGFIDNPNLLSDEVTNAITFVGVVGSIVGILLVTHEYRYNTIMYTLTAAKRRTVVLFSKFFVISVFALLFSVVFASLSPAMAALGIHLHHYQLIHQHFDAVNVISRAVFVGWGFAMFGALLASIIRVQVGAVTAFFLMPAMVEPLLGLLLKKHSVYLPFSSLGAVLQHNSQYSPISYGHAALVALAYVVGGWLIAWVLFLRRDAN